MRASKHFIPGEVYKQYLKNFAVPTVDVLLFNANLTKTLLFKRNNEPLRGSYFSLGGRIIKGESMLRAAARKTKEETGIRVDPRHLVFGGVQDEQYSKSAFPRVSYHCVDVYFGYILKSGQKVTLDDQHSFAKWFSVTDKTLHPYLKKKIRNLLTSYDQAH